MILTIRFEEGIGVIGVSFWHTPRSPHSKSNREISKYDKDLIEPFCSVIV